MTKENTRTQLLVSLPRASAESADIRNTPVLADAFVASDPDGVQLGSGGGTAYILQQALATSGAASWQEWLGQDRKLLIHGSGESRRLPAYAACGKPLTPLPLIDGMPAQTPGQTLLDLQRRAYERFFLHAPPQYRVMIACGDVLVDNSTWLPTYPDADVLIVGLSASAKEAQQHGVLVCERDQGQLLNFLQKPGESELHDLGDDTTFYLDSGIWLLTERALMSMLAQCGWSADDGAFKHALPDAYDLYGEFGLALGTQPTAPSETVSHLSAASLPLREGHFYHFGTNRSLLGSVQQLSRPSREQTSFGDASMQPAGRPVVLNARVDTRLTPDHRFIWIENADVPEGWVLHQRHVLTGIPENTWSLELQAGHCLDIVPVDETHYCIRPYGFDDAFRGPLDSELTLWMGTPFPQWLKARNLTAGDAGLDPASDIQTACLFPLFEDLSDADAFVQWMMSETPETSDAFRSQWLTSPRLSNRMLLTLANIQRMTAQRRENQQRTAPVTHDFILEHWGELDLKATAETAGDHPLPPKAIDPASPGLRHIHARMYQSRLAAVCGDEAQSEAHASTAIEALRGLLIEEAVLRAVSPTRNVLEDQIVWARSPIRIDLAGGWSDTPPYCLEHGGRVVNLAVNLNGQPPIQVFARVCSEPHIVIRSIDLGLDETIRDFERLTDFGELGGGFGIARAALCLAGFDPRFHAGTPTASLPDMLTQCMGGGIELSLLAAVPKGSGLGTSSILAATVLGALGELCGLGWGHNDITERTLVLEQLLTSGGGWQDQIGGVMGGVKLAETEPGLRQNAIVRGLPDGFFSSQYVNRSVLLYYTGITRVAHGILGEIVRGIFLNSAQHLSLVEEIAHNAGFAADAVQRHDWDGFCESIGRSWSLNQMLDAGTNPPAVQEIIDKVSPHLAACKLLGAGGGGYLLLVAKDFEAGARIRDVLGEAPPNDRARFVDLSLSETGFQVTKS